MFRLLEALLRHAGLPKASVASSDTGTEPSLSGAASTGMSPEDALRTYKEMLAGTALPAVVLQTTGHDPHHALRGSRIGGRPALCEGETWPECGGRPMIFVLQLDLSTLPPTEVLPRTGLLQLFLRDDDVFGCSFPSLSGSPDDSGYLLRILSEDAAVELGGADIPLGYAFSPFEGGWTAALTGLPARHHLEMSASEDFPLDEAEMSDLFSLAEEADPGIYEAHTMTLLDGKTLMGEAWLGGYPRFTQSDAREDVRLAGMAPLLTIDSFEGVMWGDCGVLCIFGVPEKTSKGDLSQTALSWDCC